MANEYKELAEQLSNEITKKYKIKLSESQLEKKLLAKIKALNASQLDMHSYSQRSAELLSDVLVDVLTTDVLPAGSIPQEIAESCVGDQLSYQYERVNSMSKKVQSSIYKKKRIHLNVTDAIKDTDNANSIVNKIMTYKSAEDAIYLLKNPVVRYSQQVVDSFIHENAQIAYDAGFEPTVERRATAHACKWCQSVAGTYKYDDVSNNGNDVWRRHNNCRCTVVTEIDKGVFSSARTKKTSSKKEALENETRWNEAKRLELAKRKEQAARKKVIINDKRDRRERISKQLESRVKK